MSTHGSANYCHTGQAYISRPDPSGLEPKPAVLETAMLPITPQIYMWPAGLEPAYNRTTICPIIHFWHDHSPEGGT